MSTTNPEVTLEAIDVSAIVAANTESAEVTALKKKVKKVADNYTRRYGWCDEVKKALAEIGIEEEQAVVVEVTLSNPATTVPVTVSPTLLLNKSGPQQAALLAGLVGTVQVMSSRGWALASRPLTADDVTAMRLVENSSTSVADAWMFTSNSGRVTHLLRGVHDPQRRQEWVRTACGDRVYVSNAVASKTSTPNPTHCKRCEKAVGS